MYYNLQGEKKYDYGYTKEGTYHIVVPGGTPTLRRKQSTDRNDLRGKKCPSCGLTRSMMNKCDCNS